MKIINHNKVIRMENKTTTNSLSFGYQSGIGDLSPSRTLTYIFTVAVLSMISTLTFIKLFAPQVPWHFNQYLIDLFSYWNMYSVASYLANHASPTFMFCLLPVLIIIIWQFCGFLIGINEDENKRFLKHLRK